MAELDPRPRLLMCAPAQYGVRYTINPWMRPQSDEVVRAPALSQWQRLHAALSAHAEIELVEPLAGLPDMVFTANAGFVLGDKVVPSNFRHAERQGEQAPFRAWFEARGFELVELPAELAFEGAGDALLDRAEPLAWMGHGFRTDASVAGRLSEMLDVEVQPLRLVDPRFYHLDTCLCPLVGGELLYYPRAFDAESLARIESRVPARRRIAVGDRDATAFACNAVSVGKAVLLNRASRALGENLARHGYAIEAIGLEAFIQAGGSAKCLTLRLDEQLARASAGSGIQPAGWRRPTMTV